MSFGDSDKAIFGAGSDLQISHDGNNSLIAEVGTGNLHITAQDLRLQSANNQDAIKCIQNGAVTLYYDNAAKLATTSTGIQVTGNIANASGDLTLDVAGDIILDAGGQQIVLKDDGTTFAEIYQASNNLYIESKGSDKDIIFRGNDGGSDITALTLDMSAAGDAIFNSDVVLGSTGKLRSNGDDDSYLQFNQANTLRAVIGDSTRMIITPTETVFNEDSGDFDFRVESNGNANMLFVDAGNDKIGVNTSSPDAMFTVDTNVSGSSTGTLARFHASKGESDSTFLQIAATRHGTASVQRVQLQAFDDDGSTGRTLALNPSGGSVGIGLNDPSARLEIGGMAAGEQALLIESGRNDALSNGLARINITDSNCPFAGLQIDHAGTGAAIISNGDVLVGLTATEAVGTNAGTQLRADGLVYAAVTSDAHILSRRSSDGAILNFRKDTTTVGTIAANGGSIIVGSGDTGLYFDAASDRLIPVNPATASGRDNAVNLGGGSERFRNLYLSGGVFLGGTGSANKLSDYEEGLHTYTLKGASSGSATIPIRNGYTKLAYTKIGRMVTITGKIETLGSHSATGALRLSLPFTAANLTDQAGVAGGSCFVYRTSQSIYDNPAILPSTADPYAIFYYNTTSGDVATINANNLDAQFEILVSFSYFTNA